MYLIYRTDILGNIVFYSDGDTIFTTKDYKLNRSRIFYFLFNKSFITTDAIISPPTEGTKDTLPGVIFLPFIIFFFNSLVVL